MTIKRYTVGEEQVTKLFYLFQKNLITLRLSPLIRIIDPTFIVGLGNEVIKLNQERFDKELYSAS